SLDEWKGWRTGNQCVCELNGKKNEASVKWIGRLKELIGVHAGVQFDDPVGVGTGLYQGEEVFRTAPNHAGFVRLSGISRPVVSNPSNAHPSTDLSQKEKKEKNVGMRSEEKE
ncbi:hypothetical protein PENTCL1PPCAC_7362, partial [Pristionchus entomophagus]